MRQLKEILLFVFFAVSGLMSCSDVDLTSTKEHHEGSVFPSVDEEDTTATAPEPPKPVIPDPEFYYLCAEYPEDYDWIRDPQYGIVDCNLILMNKKKRLATIPAGYKTGIYPESDMTFLKGPQMISQNVDAGHTVVSKNGKELLRFEGEEMLTGILENEGLVYTVGVPKDGSGWNYRCDGKLLASSDKDQPLGPLYEDSGYVLFHTFYEKADYSGNIEYSLVKNGVSERVTDSFADKLVDYIVFKGTRYELTTFYDTRRPVLFTNGTPRYLNWPDAYKVETKGLFVGDDEKLYVLGAVYKDQDSRVTNVLWQGTTAMMEFPSEMDVRVCVSAGERVVAIGMRRKQSRSLVLYDSGKMIDIPSGYKMPGRNCIAAAQGHYLVCFNPTSPKEQPLAAQDGLVRNIDVRGSVLSVSCETFEPR